MRKTTSRVFRVLALGITALAFTALGQSVARAEMVTFSTTGCFGAACTPVATQTTFGSGTAQATFLQQVSTTVNTSTPSGFTVADLGTITLSGEVFSEEGAGRKRPFCGAHLCHLVVRKKCH